MKNLYLTMNLFGYEKLTPPPELLPKNLTTCYITDNDEIAKQAKKLGWDIVKYINLFKDVIDKLDKRISVARIKCFPKEFVPEVDDFEFIFICDSNISKIRKDYQNFIDSCTEDKCLFLTSKYYSNGRDNIVSELMESKQPRWSYNFDGMIKSTDKYMKELESKGINYKNLSVVSGKYIGWNLNHKYYDEISNKIYNERKVNLQGNIILTYISGIYKNEVNNFATESWARSELNNHNFQA
jgi:hypothetical protein